ncbi:hypothetical protein LTR97_004344 [Elasticomyces elasticus]|uniref:O-methyltransferase C-terminal domain-containing protein n=1 Tax=Elasticomyces elasticus TaxID=574655 RepID=A0AAN7WCU4_9PEZI|nr:hypothetical protein LTR97_004344 [Elasticomyces elasticus]
MASQSSRLLELLVSATKLVGEIQYQLLNDLTAKDIAEKTNTDVHLVACHMRLLAAGGSVHEPAAYQHARAYYLHAIFHEWPDADCTTILSNVRDAMEPGYSTALVNDIVLPNTGCSWQYAAHDLTMMAALSGKERTLAEWRDLIGGVEELKIEKIWTLEEHGESLIEIVRVS